MPSILTHAAVPLAIGLGLGRRTLATPVLVTGIALSMLPDFDVVAFRFGIPYASEFGHRGLSHSLFAACVVAGVSAWLLTRFEDRFWPTFGFLALAMASHGLLDAFTIGPEPAPPHHLIRERLA